MMNLKRILMIQAFYYILTGAWPIIDIYSFMAVTGPKTDVWLVKMVGALTLAIGVSLLATAGKSFTAWPFAILSAAAYLTIDVYYYFACTIPAVYLLDAAMEGMLISALLFFRRKGQT